MMINPPENIEEVFTGSGLRFVECVRWIKRTTSQALDIVTVTCTIDGTLTYAIVSV